MSTVSTWETNSISLDNTLEIAESVGQKLKGGEVIELISDLGGGKTAFVKGLAKGMGVKQFVGSPSYSLSNEYQANGLTLHHFDFYRLTEPGIMLNTIDEILGKPEVVVAIEWAEIINDALPNKRLSVSINVLDENSRQFKFSYSKELAYLVPTNT